MTLLLIIGCTVESVTYCNEVVRSLGGGTFFVNIIFQQLSFDCITVVVERKFKTQIFTYLQS